MVISMSTTQGASDPSERRDNQRFDYEVLVQVTRGELSFQCTSEDVSTGGMRLRLEGPPPRVGERLRVEFKLPLLADPIRAEAEVRWIDRSSSASCGVQFMTGLRAREVWAINRLHARR
jgi:c-di-GMP-binding flagellar brake protein YcgR